MKARTQVLAEGTDPFAAVRDAAFSWHRAGSGFAATGVAARIAIPTGPGRLAKAAAEVASILGSIEHESGIEAPGSGPVAVGAVPFLDGQEGELIVPARVVGRTADGRTWQTDVSPALADAVGAPQAVSLEPTSFVVESEGGRRAWTEAVRNGLQRIRRGDIEKVVLSRKVAVWGDQPLSIPSVSARLRHAHPSCYTFVAGGFVGASPELLVRRRGRWVWSMPMAGTVERGGSSADDRRLVSALRASPKEHDEHRVVVEDVRRRLASVCQAVSVKGPEPVALSSVTHLATIVTGRFGARHDALTALALAGELHPTPAVGGAPRDAALAAIAELEGFDRGLYAGPVGWVDARGDGEWAVALRCAQIDGRRAVLSAGAGIVAGSDPEAEWTETQAKLEPMLRALVRV